MANLQHDVLVHKNIELKFNESLRDFTQSLSVAVRKFMQQKLNLSEKESSVFMIEVFSTALIVDVFKFGTPGVRFFAVQFVREKNGDFSFNNAKEVERVTSFVPKQGAELTKKISKALGVCDGWIEKSFWGSVL